LAAALKALGATMPVAIIPRQWEKSRLAEGMIRMRAAR
jgi:hypothetical protein